MKISMRDPTLKSLDDLEKGIKQLLLENRYSFTNEEKVLLIECLSILKEFNKINEKTGIINLELFSKIIEILLKVMIISDHIKEFL